MLVEIESHESGQAALVSYRRLPPHLQLCATVKARKQPPLHLQLNLISHNIT